MKKLLLAGVVGIAAVGLVACDYAEGVDHDFGTRATEVFVEIDDDTMTHEVSDTDDVSNYELVALDADTPREVAATDSIGEMIELQPLVVKGDPEALKKYLLARETAMTSLGVSISGSGHTVPEFNFYEED